MKAFEAQLQADHWTEDIDNVLKQMKENTITPADLHEVMEGIQPRIVDLRQDMKSFEDSLKDKPTALLWLSFLKMVDILQIFLFHERKGNWPGYLSAAAKMLPYLAAAGHHKYAQESLPLYLKEMKELQTRAPLVHEAMMAGAFVGRHSEGCHSSVSPDMILEQTYNADAK
jgi:hypothetical protein